MEIPVAFEAKETGFSEIACAQLCGLSHFACAARSMWSPRKNSTPGTRTSDDEFIDFDDF
jgi:hypothetical protein